MMATKVVALVLNSRPVCVRYCTMGGDFTKGFLTPITPNMLLRGRRNEDIPIRDYDSPTRPLDRLRYIQELVGSWWEQKKQALLCSKCAEGK